MTQSISIGNDSYIVIVANKGEQQVKVADYPMDVRANMANIMSGSNPLGSTLRVMDAGWNSDIARSLLSNSSIPTPVIGRITSSISDIISTGRLTSTAVWEDAWGSITNSIDEVAIDMGFPSATALSNAINPNSPPLSAKNVAKFGNALKNKLTKKQSIGEQKINDSDISIGEGLSEAIIVRLPLCTSDKETWTSSLPSKKTEQGFDIVTSVQNDNLEKDFTVLINDKTIVGLNMYATRDLLYNIWQDKYTFDVYVCDADIRENRVYEHCMFSSVSLSTEGKNSLTVDLSITKIPEWKIKMQKIDKSQYSMTGSSSRISSSSKTRKTKTATSTKNNQTKTSNTQRTSNSSASGQTNLKKINDTLRDYKNLRDMDRSSGGTKSLSYKNTYQQRLKTLGYNKDVEVWYQENQALGR